MNFKRNKICQLLQFGLGLPDYKCKTLAIPVTSVIALVYSILCDSKK